MSQRVYEFKNAELALLEESARRLGFVAAICLQFGFRIASGPRIKERAHWHYVNGPSSFFDPYLLARSWLKAVEEALNQGGDSVQFRFEIDRYVLDRPDLPKKPDN